MPKPRTQSTLRINPTPFKPTLLSIPPSPCSPRTPLTPFLPSSKAAASPSSQASTIYYPQETSSAPSSPLSWVWQCHQCSRSYHLGVTRRCLEDGHQFCSGTTSVKAWRKPANQQRRTRRHRACASEFDYQGWKTWGRWRRGGARTAVKDCWNTCDYPSECRWGKKFGIHTPTPSSSTFPCSAPVVPDAAPVSPVEGVLRVENVVGLEQDKADLWGALMASAKRRKSDTASSPLASVAEEDKDGDVVMSSPNPSPSPSSSEESSPSSSPTKAVGSGTIDMLKDLIKRTTGGKEREQVNRAHEYAVEVLGLTVPKPVLRLRGGEQVCLSEEEKFREGFEPLERVRSRKDLVGFGIVGGL
ncbi:hypothetical protein CC86DRAFT_362525 [Ophiobolus disseminans]|uniref:Uncharacterized protein n=1 Tax=Ophiobolus disseminans TaxID=1469910 RepID=A0A6A6ZF22_9PLEO|nr:hypothetical protein CC86DRAFT_362525 [Ophiobolus disseminans]